jgi:hypothetical protein
MIFAKNELMFDDIKVAVLLDIFWKLLEFNPEETADAGKPEKRPGQFEPIDERPEL